VILQVRTNKKINITGMTIEETDIKEEAMDLIHLAN
jgi:hypothetical protein